MAPTLRVGIRFPYSAGQTVAFFAIPWSVPDSLKSEVARLGIRDTERLTKEDSEETQAHDQLFASLDNAPAKPGLRSPIMARKLASDAKQKPDLEEEEVLEVDLMEAIAQAWLDSRQR